MARALGGMKLGFFILPFFLYAGVAGQAAGLYLWALIMPLTLVVWRRQAARLLADRRLLVLGGSLMLLWFLFPLSNLLRAFLPGLWELTSMPRVSPLPASLEGMRLSALLASKMPSTWFGAGVFLLIFWGAGTLQERWQRLSADGERSAVGEAPDLLAAFCKGSAWACLVFAVYAVLQFIGGYDYRLVGHQLPASRMLSESPYFRISGFYGHPLSMAAVALGQLGFFATLLYKSLEGGFRPRSVSAQPLRWIESRRAQTCLLLLVIAQLAFLLMSGGRAAVLCGFALLAGLVGTSMLRRGSVFTFAVAATSLGLACAGLFSMLGLLGRFQELASQWQDMQSGEAVEGLERLLFWRVHWQIFTDAPWFGQGAAFLSHGLRALYYEAAGLATLAEQYNAHNIYLEVLAGIGGVGSACALFLLLAINRQLTSLQSNAARPEPGYILQAARTGLFLNAVHGLTQNTFFDASLMVVYLAYLFLFFWQAKAETDAERAGEA